MPTADAVYHLATPEEWARARASGEVAPASLATEGFVHCSTVRQLAATIERHLAGIDDLVLLRIDLGASVVAEHLRWVEVRPGQRYPHVHAALPLDAVVEAVPWHRGDPLPEGS